MTAGEVSDKRVFYNDAIQLGTPGTHKVNKGVMEWPFEFELSPSMPESVEGMANSWLVYNLHASVERPGWNQKDLTTSLHIRIIRTLGPDQMESTRSRVRRIANELAGLRYSHPVPSQTFVHKVLTEDYRQTPMSGRIRSATAFPSLPTRLSLEHRLSQMSSYHQSGKVSPWERLTCV